MGRRNKLPSNLSQWVEFFWLWLANPTFREARDKRKAYYEHCLAKAIYRPLS
jgi:hypothetical protein